jgi:uncharacterized protein (DUF305 family)
MNAPSPRNLAAACLGILVLSACVTATGRTGAPPAANQTTATPAGPVTLSHRNQPPGEADVHFMSGMIPHHAQAVKIAGWAATHGASQSIRILCERIVVGQRDEIAIMQTWLRDHGQKVPAADATHLRMTMAGMEHDMLMPGMLTDEELRELDEARGLDFDRLFLKAMIKHHLGAITMVNTLFGSQGAAQDDIVYKLATDIYADQTTEIDRMQKMLDALPAGER